MHKRAKQFLQSCHILEKQFYICTQIFITALLGMKMKNNLSSSQGRDKCRLLLFDS